jgi:hypothetical protein
LSNHFNSKKPIDDLAKRLASFTNRNNVRVNRGEEETELEKMQRFAALRESRAKKVNAFEKKTYVDVHDDITQEEKEYYLLANLQCDPRMRYRQNRLEAWIHPSNFLEHCDCSACQDKEKVDRCLKGCKRGMCANCPYIPEYGLETFDHIIEYKGTDGYDTRLAEWRGKYKNAETIPAELLVVNYYYCNSNRVVKRMINRALVSSYSPSYSYACFDHIIRRCGEFIIHFEACC